MENIDNNNLYGEGNLLRFTKCSSFDELRTNEWFMDLIKNATKDDELLGYFITTHDQFTVVGKNSCRTFRIDEHGEVWWEVDGTFHFIDPDGDNEKNNSHKKE